MSTSRILLVDDNRDLADGLALFLEDEDYQVTVAYSGEAAVSESRENAFDFVLMDFKLPGINGLEASRRIHEERPGTPALIMTGFHLEQLLSEAAGRGLVCTLRPPISDVRLRGALATVQPQGVLLVLGDGSFAAERIDEVLSAAGHRVALARSPGQAVEARCCSKVEVLLLDLGLPVTRSLEALLEEGAHGGALVTVIVADASMAEPPAADVFRSSAVTGCFFKPFDLDELLEVVANYCGEASTQRAVAV